MKMDVNDIMLPGSEMKHTWQVDVNGVFQERAEVNVRLVQPEVELPADLLARFETGKAEIIKLRELHLAEVL